MNKALERAADLFSTASYLASFIFALRQEWNIALFCLGIGIYFSIMSVQRMIMNNKEDKGDEGKNNVK